MKNIIAGLIIKYFVQLDFDTAKSLLEIPPRTDMGDYSFPCFSLTKLYKKNPQEIASDLQNKMNHNDLFSRIDVIGGYCNFFLDKKNASSIMLHSLLDDKNIVNEERNVVIEFCSPNTNKPLHLGHLRNMAIGESLSRLFEFCGNTVKRTTIFNDRSIAICKSMAAYKKFGSNTEPHDIKIKSDHFVGNYYVKYAQEVAKNKNLEEEAKEMLRKWEAHDTETVDLWKKMNDWVYEGFAETFRMFEIDFDKMYYESDVYLSGKEMIYKGLKSGILQKKTDGSVYIDLQDKNLGEKTLLRSDGTSLYIVQDLYLALLKYSDFNFDLSLYIVGNEQIHHFNVLKEILNRLGYPIGEKIEHYAYGMIELPDGKMKSREGTVVDADDFITEIKDLAKTEVESRYNLSPEELEKRSLSIALASIKYHLLKIDSLKNMVFDPKKAVSFEGDTGPYLLYSYARACSIVKKKGMEWFFHPDSYFTVTHLNDVLTSINSEGITEKEYTLVKKLSVFRDIIVESYTKKYPTIIASYSFELSQIFNDFYHNCPVINSTNEYFRLFLVHMFYNTLQKCLYLLGIGVITEM